ncbi:hypothetical protein [Paraburkholderia sp. MM6662-R1]|uniref:hypothetical protein n=1 Tax=Paraburkholderia sp. MM6662-R1 TaxID=2991066 RepID=UPI003D23DD97
MTEKKSSSPGGESERTKNCCEITEIGEAGAANSADVQKTKRPARGGPEIHVETWRRRNQYKP